MLLSLRQPRSYILLLLLVSHSLLCEVQCQGTLGDMFDQAIILSQNMKDISAEMLNEFLQDIQYRLGNWFPEKTVSGCRTSFLATPETIEEAKQTQSAVLLKLVLSILENWRYALYYLSTEMQEMPEAPDAVLSRAKVMETQNRKLLEDVERIVSKVHPGVQETDYPIWKTVAPLQTNDEELAFYNSLQCLRRDSNKVNTYIKILRCRFTYDMSC